MAQNSPKRILANEGALTHKTATSTLAKKENRSTIGVGSTQNGGTAVFYFSLILLKLYAYRR